MKFGKIFVNGNYVSVRGNNITIVNGRVIGGEKGEGKVRKIDEKKFEAANNVEKISIDSSKLIFSLKAFSGIKYTSYICIWPTPNNFFFNDLSKSQ